MKRLALLLGLVLCCLGLNLGQPRAEASGAVVEKVCPQVVQGEELATLASNTLSILVLEVSEGRRYELEPVSLPRELALPEGEYHFEVTVPNGVRFWGNTAVQLNAIVDGKPFRQIVCQYKVHLFDQVAVAARLLLPGEPLGESDFHFEEKEIGSAPRKYVTDRKDIIGMVLSRPVQPGQVIQRFMLHRPVVMESGKQVIIMGKSGAAVVRMEGIAVDKGRVGDLIRVKNLLTGRIVRAKVIDDHTVEVVK